MEEALIQSTKLLVKSYNAEVNLSLKVDILEQVIENIKILKAALETKDFQDRLGKTEKSAQEKLAALTDKDFLAGLAEKIKQLVDKYQSSSTS